jgi:hypothetical protein
VWDWTAHRFGFNSLSALSTTRVADCGAVSDMLIYFATDGTVSQWCGSGVIGCFDWHNYGYDTYVNRWEVFATASETGAIIRIKKSYMDGASQAARIHTVEHEVGHGFGLGHHNPGCTVMSDPPCTYWVDTPDITTARCLYGYAC